MAMKIRLYDNETRGFGSIDLEDGKYTFEIVDVEPSPAKSGRPRLQLRLRTVDGPVKDTTAFDWWNLPTQEDKPDSFTKNFWHDVVKAWPPVYDQSQQILHEDNLKGRRFHATVVHEEDPQGVVRMRLKSYRFQSNAGSGAAAADASAAPSVGAEAAAAGFTKPSRFQQP
jgi:hypothetical protein